MQTGYEPLNTLKPVGEGLWLIDGPAVTRGWLPYPTRSTVALLGDGSLWVHAPTALSTALQSELDALGPVAHIVLANTGDFPFLSEWQEAYPQARCWRVEDLKGGDVWSGAIDQMQLAGSSSYQEVVFFHRASETAIVSELIVNFETETLAPWLRPLVWLAGTDHPGAGLPPALRRAYRDKDALAESIEQIIAWRPRRLILSHGKWFERDAVAELERRFRKLLRDRMWARAVDEHKARAP